MTDEGHELKVELKGLMVDPSSNVPIVILRSEESQRILPIWIGIFEANAIALQLQGESTARPMTHDLLQSAVGSLGGELKKVVICDLQGTTFYALLHIQQNDEMLTVDARPSDAIALALRAEAPIYVHSTVLDKAQAADLTSEVNQAEKLKKYLEDLDPEDLGKYTM